MTLDLERLIRDLGGARAVAAKIGVGRTVPYGWLRRGSVSSLQLAKIKRSWPEIAIDHYFREPRNERDAGGGTDTCRAGLGGHPD